MTTPSICIVNPPWDKELTIIPNCACHITRIKTWLSSHTSRLLILIHWLGDLQKPHRLLESLIVIFSQFLTLKFSHIFNVQNSTIYSQHWKVSIVRDTIHARFHIFYFPTDYRNITIFLLNVIHGRRNLFKCVHNLYLRIRPCHKTL